MDDIEIILFYICLILPWILFIFIKCKNNICVEKYNIETIDL